MTTDLTSQGLLILVIAPNLEEVLIDLLLEDTSIPGFTSSNVSGHGAKRAKLSLMEQVTGRQQRIQLMVYSALSDLQNLINVLKAKFENADIRYILIPVADSQMI